jgi:4-diphosphocytidyl-2-C-methyl-D-erythritol kinase
MVFFPNAKINLGLFITGKRPDGFHNIQSILFPIPLCDALEIIKAGDGRFEFSVSGLPIPGAKDGNIVLKAWTAMRTAFDLSPVKIYLHKAIPMGAGLGGGSADAAFAIRLIDVLFGLKMTPAKMTEFAVGLGMDCPFFISNQPAYAFERGDKLRPSNVSLSGKFLVVVKPPGHVNTAEAYSDSVPRETDFSPEEVVKMPVDQWGKYLINDFEKAAIIKYPEIGKIKNDLVRQGAVFASMSGSGSAVYGIFDDAVDLADYFPEYYYWHGQLY